MLRYVTVETTVVTVGSPWHAWEGLKVSKPTMARLIEAFSQKKKSGHWCWCARPVGTRNQTYFVGPFGTRR